MDFLARNLPLLTYFETINDWSTAVHDKKSVAVAYIDYTGILLKWIKSFLSDRIQCPVELVKHYPVIIGCVVE